MSQVVPDASVILKWVLPETGEQYYAQAEALRQSYLDNEVTLIVPSLWRFEIGNTLARRYPDHVLEDITDLQNMGMREPLPSQQWLEAACSLAQEYSVSFYDTAYHALAVVESGLFVTADERYLRAVGSHANVCHLADWSL